MRIWRAFLLFLRCAPLQQPVDWTKADEHALDAFMRTLAGHKLRATLLAHYTKAAQTALQTANPRDCGIASGAQGILVWLTTLSEAPPVEEANNEAE